MKNNSKRNAIWVLGSIFIGIGSTAAAQGSGDEPTQLDEVVVTGIRGAERAAIETKRNSEIISDSIAITDIGELPDFNIAEAISRIPGVSTEQARGEDRYITVRGLQSAFNYVSLDGAIIPGTDQSARSVPMDIFPSSLVTGITVSKSFNASMDGNAIGAHIDMKTRSAFDTKNRYLLLEASIGSYDQDEGPNDAGQSYTAKVTFADRFGVNDNWGVVLSASAYNRENYTDLPAVASTRIDWYDDLGTRYTDPAAPEHNGFPVPQGGKHFLYFNDRERYGGFAKLEYVAADGRLSAFVSGFDYRFNDNENRYGVIIERNRNNAPENQTATSGSVTTGKLQSEVISQVFEFNVSGLQAGIEFDVADNQELSLSVNASNGTYEQPFTWDKFDTGQISELAYTYNYGGGYDYPAVTLADPSYYNDPSNFLHQYRRDRSRNSDESVKEARLDYSLDSIGNSNWNFSAGAKLRMLDREITRHDLEFKLADRSDFTLDQAIFDYQYTPEGINTPMYLVNPALTDAFFADNQSLFNPNGNNDLNDFRNNYSLEEDVVAAYAMLDYRGEKVHVNVGLRYEDTDYEAVGFQRLTEGGVDTYPSVTFSNDYDYLLPSFGLTYWINDDLAFRAAYSETIGRPSYNDLRPTQTRSVTLGDPNTPGDPDVISVSGGNVNLKPRESSNYDLSLEYYFADGDGLLSVALFRKDIKNDIFRLNTSVEEVINGVDTITNYSRPENLQSSDVTGQEISFVLGEFFFLRGAWRGFGLNLNYTHLNGNSTLVNRSSGEVRDPGLYGLLRQPENIANASLKYTYGDLETRVAYKYHDLRLESINSDYARDRLHAPRESVDFQVRYNLSDSIYIKFDAKNVTESSQQSVNNATLQLPVWERAYGRSYWFGVSYRAF